ncbi:MAG: Lrp/AsnC family transcriptional regulator [Lachnospiraceae bacterium]
MDHIDRCIVDILQHNARLPVKEIASRVSLSSPAVCARIERLEKSGVLAGYQAMINVTSIGYLVKAFINLEVEPDQKPAFYPYIESCTNVVECSCVTGDYSMLIEAYFHTTQELDQFVNYLQKFGRTRTQIVFSTCVEHRGIPLSEASTLQPPNSLKKSEKNDSDK